MDFRAILMGLAFALMWSSAFTSARMIVADAPPLTALAARFLVSGVIGVGLALAMGQSFRLNRAQWRATIIFGISQNALYLGLNFVAMQWVQASLAAIIASAMPLLVALLGWLFLGQRLRPLGVFGMLAGVSGGNVMMIVGLQMFVGAAILSVAALVLEDFSVHWTPRLVGAFAYTTLVPGVLATWVWFWLVARIGAVKASTFHFLNPFFGVAVAAMLLSERVGPLDVLGVAVIAGGILAVQISRAAL